MVCYSECGLRIASQPGLTTGHAPFIEDPRGRGELYLRQPYELYSPENHATWARLFRRMEPRWERYANRHYLAGLEALCLSPDRIPLLLNVDAFLRSRTGFQAKPVAGYVPAFLFFDCLRRREFPTTITIRPPDRLDYLPEPDIFHDLAGHVPMHTDPQFAAALVRFGECAVRAAEHVRDSGDTEVLRNIIKAMARVFWFTVEFGLMRQRHDLRVYGSGLLSSFGEIQHAIASPEVQRLPFRLEDAVHQSFQIDHYQPLLFIVDSFDQLFGEIETLEQWIRAGKLNHVAPGEPEVREEDLRSFLRS